MSFQQNPCVVSNAVGGAGGDGRRRRERGSPRGVSPPKSSKNIAVSRTLPYQRRRVTARDEYGHGAVIVCRKHWNVTASRQHMKNNEA